MDLQAVTAVIGTKSATVGLPRRSAASANALPAGSTYTVNTGGDRADVNVGDGVCADSQGAARCAPPSRKPTGARATTASSSTSPAGRPGLIQLSGRCPLITSTKGTLTIDGYTQPGASVNTATIGATAVTGVEVRGNGSTPTRRPSTSPLAATPSAAWPSDNVCRGIMIDGVNAHDNKIIGNWIGFTGSGASRTAATSGILINTGATHNLIGTPNLADRNLIGNWTKRHRPLRPRHGLQHHPEQRLLHPTRRRRRRPAAPASTTTSGPRTT